MLIKEGKQVCAQLTAEHGWASRKTQAGPGLCQNEKNREARSARNYRLNTAGLLGRTIRLEPRDGSVHNYAERAGH